ncbi:tetratricopeptide repeat protein, partial [Acidobacteriia bacterium AH_259_A11_L15]|nr:tetratricopeptide repeat protein [Acidobacteriia bacterium AH_259_A11_L15]
MWYLLARSYERLGNLTQAIAAAERVQRLGYTGRPRMSYRLARMYAQTGDESAALDWLERALAERYEDRPGIQGDGAFAALRDNPRFIKLAGILPAEG